LGNQSTQLYTGYRDSAVGSVSEFKHPHFSAELKVGSNFQSSVTSYQHRRITYLSKVFLFGLSIIELFEIKSGLRLSSVSF
jgi:hypothetical protein